MTDKLEEARMSAAVKLQRAFEREQQKSAASRARGQELLDKAKEDAKKKVNEAEEKKKPKPESKEPPPTPVIPVHQIGVIVSQPDHPHEVKRDKQIQKFLRVATKSQKDAMRRAKQHFEYGGFVVHDMYHHSMVEETEMQEGLKPEHKMRPGWMLKADPELKAKVDANKKKYKEFKQNVGKKTNEEVELEESMTDSWKKIQSMDKGSVTGGKEEAKKRHAYLTAVHAHHKRFGNDTKKVKAEIERLNQSRVAEGYVPDHSGNLNKKDASTMSKVAALMAKEKAAKAAKKPVKEEVISEGAYEKAEENKKSADAAKKQGDMFAHHLHMADHHDNLSQWHDSKGRHNMADIHASKAASHHEKAMSLKEETIEEATPYYNKPSFLKKMGRVAKQERQAREKKEKEAKEVKESYHDNRSGFSKRRREDDEYHVPDPVTRTHKIGFHVSKEGGEKHHRTVTISNSTKSKEEATVAAKAHLEKQGYKIHEEAEQIDELSKTTLGNYIKKAANDKADTAFHRGYRAYSRSVHKPHSEPMRNKVHSGQENRNKGIKRAVARLTKEEAEQIEERNKENATKRKMMDASRGARYKLNNPVPDRDEKHTSAQAHNKAIGRALRNEQTEEQMELDEKLNMKTASMKTVIDDFADSNAPQFRGKSGEKRRQMAIAAKLKGERSVKEEKLNSFKSYLEEDLDEAAWPGTPEYKAKFGDTSRGKVGSQTHGAKGTQTVTATGVKHERNYEKAEKETGETEKQEKRGRGRPKGSASGARQKGSAAKGDNSKADYTGFKLHLPSRN